MSRVIYFVERKSDGLVKIGFTKDIRRRLYELAAGHGELHLLGVLEGGQVREKILHVLFETARVEGEFFRLTDKLRAFIEEHTYYTSPYAPDPNRLVVLITLREHLDALQAEENRKPPSERRPVPSLLELADAVNLSKQGMYNFANGDVKLVNRQLLGDIITELQRRGFPTDVPDLMKSYPQSKAVRQ